MDDMAPGINDKLMQMQSGGGLINGPSFRRGSSARPTSISAPSPGSPQNDQPRIVVVVVHKDENGYGMKVSGDNPVFVQSVKEGGAAVRAGLQCGDMIIKVNGVNVTHSTHTQVVSLIRESAHVELTVQQRPQRLSATAVSPRLHSTPRTDRITPPQPVDHDKLRQLESQREKTFRLMLEKEQLYVDALRSELAKCLEHPEQEQKITKELLAAERRITTLQETLSNIIASSSSSASAAAENPFNNLSPNTATNPFLIPAIAECGEQLDDLPPPLPSRNSAFSINNYSQGSNNLPPLPPRISLNFNNTAGESGKAAVVDGGGSPAGASASVLGHHRTKSNPDSVFSLAEASSRLISTESMHEIYRRAPKQGSCDVDSPHESPAGTPPPPYRPLNDDLVGDDEVQLRLHGTNDSMESTMRSSMSTHIMSMEEDESSDQEGHTEDHGPFKSLPKLWEHHAHLVVFMNYVISNYNPASLLFYLITDLYKEGNVKEMKRWAYEIHSSFLVPDAPLRLNYIDENVAKEIDDVLLNDFDKEEILRKVFRKPRLKAKEELYELLLDFQQKRLAGLNTLYGPTDAILDETINDKGKELKIIEGILVPKLEPYIADMEKECKDIKKFTTAAALGTIMAKTFGVRSSQASALLDRCPTFVSKDKTIKARLLIGKGKRMNICGHQFVAHTYYHIAHCNHCGLIIWGIGPQGYQCTNCNFNVHRLNCVRLVEEACPGPMTKKERADNRISKLMERIRPAERDARRKPSSSAVHPIGDRGKKSIEEAEDIPDPDLSDRAGLRNAERRPDPLREAEERTTNEESVEDRLHGDLTHHPAKVKNSAAIINRSESVKEHKPQKKRERRKTSDPNLSKTNDVDLESQPGALSYSGSSSNSSISTRSLDSPCAADTMVTAASSASGATNPPHSYVSQHAATNIPQFDDSDMDAEANLPDWTRPVAENILSAMSAREKSRQEVINELFHTERTHVRGLKVLVQLFYRPMAEAQLLHPDQFLLLFQNLEEMLDIHSRFNNAMKARRKAGSVIGEISDILLDMFDGEQGDEFQRAASTFCAKQSIALAMLKELRKKDVRLANFLNEAEGSPLCRRLQLKDLLPVGFLRLTKYPLLFEKLIKHSTDLPPSEVRGINRALDRSRQILNEVNRSVAAALSESRLAEIQKRLDKSHFDRFLDYDLAKEFRNLDLREHRLIHEGPLTWQINRQKVVDVHALLLEDLFIMMQRTDEREEKFVLKFFNVDAEPLCPIVRMGGNAFVRRNAVQHNSLFLISGLKPKIYELCASSVNERDLTPAVSERNGPKRRSSVAAGGLPQSLVRERRSSIVHRWFRHLSDAADAYKNRNGRTSRSENPTASQISSPEHDTSDDHVEKTKEEESIEKETDTDLDSTTTSHESENTDSSQTHTLTTPNRKSAEPASPAATRRKTLLEDPPLRLTTVENPLINPSEVTITEKFVLTAEPVQTPYERIRVQDQIIRKALETKQQLVADLFHVPREHFETIAELAGEPDHRQGKEAAELVLAAISQANQLSEALNECLRVTEEDAVSAASETAAYSPRFGRRKAGRPGVPAEVVQGIANRLNSNLAQLLELVKEREEERDQLSKQLQKSRELLHAMHENQQKRGVCGKCTDGQGEHGDQLPHQQPVDNMDRDCEGDSERVLISDTIIEESVEIVKTVSDHIEQTILEEINPDN